MLASAIKIVGRQARQQKLISIKTSKASLVYSCRGRRSRSCISLSALKQATEVRHESQGRDAQRR
jgi:hypothetical protein